jgi:transcriptional regulator with XRE-family HTH domain
MPNGDAHQLGVRVRERRVALGLSVRALAARAGISPAYVSAIEAARNPSTGRPPTLSVAVARQLSDALELDVSALISPASSPGDHAAHVLAYVLTPPPGGIIEALDATYGEAVDHWLHIVDPRLPEEPASERVTLRRFALGLCPYATPYLDAAALEAALDREVAVLAPALRGRRVGLLIADCSAVMRFLHDASAAVAMETIWHDLVARVWQRRLGAPPAVDVCAYLHDDIIALGLTIDQLQTALDLVSRHDTVMLIQDHRTLTGAAAIQRILIEARPSGASPIAWAQLASAAARTLTGGRLPAGGLT